MLHMCRSRKKGQHALACPKIMQPTSRLPFKRLRGCEVNKWRVPPLFKVRCREGKPLCRVHATGIPEWPPMHAVRFEQMPYAGREMSTGINRGLIVKGLYCISFFLQSGPVEALCFAKKSFRDRM